MALKFIVFIILAYWIIRAAVNLWQAIQNDPRAANAPRGDRFDEDEVRRVVEEQTYRQTWHVKQNGAAARRDEHIEDARWEDV